MSMTIVVVDDDPEFRMIVRYLLSSLSASLTLVGEAASGEEGLDLVRRERPTVLLTDIVMPGAMDGIALTRRVRETWPEIKIILMSSYTEDAYRRLASDSGADTFVNKRVIHSSLPSAIRDLTGREISGGGCAGEAGASSSPAAPPN